MPAQATIVHLSWPTFLFFSASAAPGLHWAGIFPMSSLGFNPPLCWLTGMNISSPGPSMRQNEKPSRGISAPVKAAQWLPKLVFCKVTTRKPAKEFLHAEYRLFSFFSSVFLTPRVIPHGSDWSSSIPQLLAPFRA